jgi:hypothetical protein
MENKEEKKMISNKINNIDFINNKNSSYEELLFIQNLIKKESALKELCKTKSILILNKMIIIF